MIKNLFFALSFLSCIPQLVATHHEVQIEKTIKVMYSNPTNILLEGVALSPSQQHNFETPAGSIRVSISMLGEGQSSDLLHSFSLGSTNEEIVDISKLVAPLDLVKDNLFFEGHLVSDGQKVAAGTPSKATCDKVTLGSTVIFSLKKIEDETYKLQCQSSHL